MRKPPLYKHLTKRYLPKLWDELIEEFIELPIGQKLILVLAIIGIITGIILTFI